MANQTRSFLDAKLIIGIAIILIGAILLLDNLGYDLGVNILSFWPVILILIGISHLSKPQETRQATSGWILLIVGIIFLLRNLGVIHFGFGVIWPVILIVVGLAILRHALRGQEKGASKQNFIDLTFVLGGGEFKYNSASLEGGKVAAFMGGGTIDLRDADMEQDTMTIDTFAFWGGIEILVPNNWQVNMQGTPLLGGMENKTTYRKPEDPGKSASVKSMMITGTAIMGGVEVKN